jgi:predicted amidohydrolase YtcJ
MRFLSPLLLIALMTACEPAPPDVELEKSTADTVFVNGKIYTVNSARPWVEAVAIENGKYIYVGDTAGAQPYIGADTRLVDLQGKMAMPGINDVHAHPWQGGFKMLYECNFSFTATPDEIAEIIKACLRDDPDAQWIRGGQWTSDFFQTYGMASPRQWLDELSADKAMYFEDDATHNAWVNSKALALAGIDKDTADPPGGTIVRDEQGAPNGVLLETAVSMVAAVIPAWTPEQNVAALEAAVRHANSWGVTGMVEARTPTEVVAAYQALDRAGGLTAWAITDLQTPRGQRDQPMDVAPLNRISEQYSAEHVHTKFAKIFLDGVPTASRTAVMLDPYQVDAQMPEAISGAPLVSQDALVADLISLDKNGFTVKIHTAGDGAVRLALDAIEQVRETNGDSGLRHELAHAGYIHADDLPRFAELDVTADLSPAIWYPRPIFDSIAGAVGDRAWYYFPIKDLLDSGANLATGSDWPSVAASINPWPSLEAMVTRRNPSDSSEQALWPEQAISLAQAIEVFTLGGAKAYRLEAVTGSVEVGKSAELVVLNQNLFEVPEEAIGDTEVLMTLFEGRVVYE